MQNGTYRIAKRHVLGCETGRFRKLNGLNRKPHRQEKPPFLSGFRQKQGLFHCTLCHKQMVSAANTRRYGCTPVAAIYAGVAPEFSADAILRAAKPSVFNTMAKANSQKKLRQTCPAGALPRAAGQPHSPATASRRLLPGPALLGLEGQGIDAHLLDHGQQAVAARGA